MRAKETSYRSLDETFIKIAADALWETTGINGQEPHYVTNGIPLEIAEPVHPVIPGGKVSDK